MNLRREVVENAHFVAGVEKRIDKMRANKSCSAGYKNAFHFFAALPETGSSSWSSLGHSDKLLNFFHGITARTISQHLAESWSRWRSIRFGSFVRRVDGSAWKGRIIGFCDRDLTDSQNL